MKVEWSDQALADLDRFAEFLHREHPSLAPVVAAEIIGKAQVLSEHPQLGRPIAGRQEYRQIVLQVLGAAYVFQYRFDGRRLDRRAAKRSKLLSRPSCVVFLQARIA